MRFVLQIHRLRCLPTIVRDVGLFSTIINDDFQLPVTLKLSWPPVSYGHVFVTAHNSSLTRPLNLFIHFPSYPMRHPWRWYQRCGPVRFSPQS